MISFKLDLTEILRKFDRYCDLQYVGTEVGLQDVCDLAQKDMQETNAHGDITGATRDSYRAFVIGGDHTGANEATSGFNAAEAAIAKYEARGFLGHGGQALTQDSGVSLPVDHRGAIFTSYTDYQKKLETENSGQKAVIGPEVQLVTPIVMKLVADGIKEVTR